jgi:hypothetical protein
MPVARRDLVRCATYNITGRALNEAHTFLGWGCRQECSAKERKFFMPNTVDSWEAKCVELWL